MGIIIKKYIKIISLVIALLIAICFILVKEYEKKPNSISNFYSLDMNELKLIRIRSGRDGSNIAITDKKDIGDIINYLLSITFTKLDNQEKTTGWQYDVAIFGNNTNESYLDITFTDINLECKIKGSKYNIESATNVTIEDFWNKYK